MLHQSIRLAHPTVRTPVEQLVSAHTGRRWAATSARDLTDFACHPCAILSDGSYSVFAKFSDAANGHEQFAIELAGLRLLAARAGVRTPTPIGVARVEGGSVLVMEAINAVERGPQHWQHIGQALARIHQVKGDTFGLHTNGYFGPLVSGATRGVVHSIAPALATISQTWMGRGHSRSSSHEPAAMVSR